MREITPIFLHKTGKIEKSTLISKGKDNVIIWKKQVKEWNGEVDEKTF